MLPLLEVAAICMFYCLISCGGAFSARTSPPASNALVTVQEGIHIIAFTQRRNNLFQKLLITQNTKISPNYPFFVAHKYNSPDRFTVSFKTEQQFSCVEAPQPQYHIFSSGYNEFRIRAHSNTVYFTLMSTEGTSYLVCC